MCLDEQRHMFPVLSQLRDADSACTVATGQHRCVLRLSCCRHEESMMDIVTSPADALTSATQPAEATVTVSPATDQLTRARCNYLQWWTADVHCGRRPCNVGLSFLRRGCHCWVDWVCPHWMSWWSLTQHKQRTLRSLTEPLQSSLLQRVWDGIDDVTSSRGFVTNSHWMSRSVACHFASCNRSSDAPLTHCNSAMNKWRPLWKTTMSRGCVIPSSWMSSESAGLSASALDVLMIAEFIVIQTTNSTMLSWTVTLTTSKQHTTLNVETLNAADRLHSYCGAFGATALPNSWGPPVQFVQILDCNISKKLINDIHNRHTASLLTVMKMHGLECFARWHTMHRETTF